MCKILNIVIRELSLINRKKGDGGDTDLEGIYKITLPSEGGVSKWATSVVLVRAKSH